MADVLKLDFWLMTYPKDYPWLPYLWKSIEQYVTGFRQCVLVLEEQDPEPTDLPSYVIVKRCRDYRGTSIPGYWGQSIEGLRSHQYTDANIIWFLESDAPFVRPINVLNDSDWPSIKPNLLYDSWEDVGAAKKWQKACEDLLDPVKAPYEMMRSHPFIYSRDIVQTCWEQISKNSDIFDYVENIHTEISQFNILNNWMFHLNSLQDGRLCNPIHAQQNRDKIPAKCTRQFWSHHGADHPDILAELKSIGLA